MPVISRIGRRSPGSLLAYGVFYALLLAGSVTMIYPFLLMLATSITGQPDILEYKLVPDFLTKQDALYARYVWDKYQDLSFLQPRYDLYGLSRLELRDFRPSVNDLDADGLARSLRELLALRQGQAKVRALEAQGSTGVSPVSASSTGGTPVLPRAQLEDQLRRSQAELTALGKASGEVAHYLKTELADLPDADLEAFLKRLPEGQGVALDKALDQAAPLGPLSAGQVEELLAGRVLLGIGRDDDKRRRQVADALTWLKELPGYLKYVGFNPPLLETTGEINRLYRDFLRSRYPNIGAVNAAYGTRYESFVDPRVPFERPEARDWVPTLDRRYEEFLQFKAATAPEYFLAAECESLWQRHLKGTFDTRIAACNAALGTSYRSFEGIRLPLSLPADAKVACHWNGFVRRKFPLRLMRLDSAAESAYRKFLQRKFQEKTLAASRAVDVGTVDKNSFRRRDAESTEVTRRKNEASSPLLSAFSASLRQAVLPETRAPLDQLNAEYETRFADWAQVRLPAPEEMTGARLAHFEEFVRGKLVKPPEAGGTGGTPVLLAIVSDKPYADVSAADGFLDIRHVRLADASAHYRQWLKRKFAVSGKAASGLGLRTSGTACDTETQREQTRLLASVSLCRTPFLAPEARSPQPEVFPDDAAVLSAVNDAYGTHYRALADVKPPCAEMDWYVTRRDAGKLRWRLAADNFKEVLEYIAIKGRALWFTALFVGLTILAQLTVNPLAAYALSRYNLSYSNKVLLFLLATMAFPAEVMLIPEFLLLRGFPLWSILAGLVTAGAVLYVLLTRYKRVQPLVAAAIALAAAALVGALVVPWLAPKLGGSVTTPLLNSLWALVLPSMAGGFTIFILKGFFDTLPKELYEAAQLDGASELRMFWQITVPLCKPVFAYIALLSFVSSYSAFIFALTVCQDPKSWTIMVWLYDLQTLTPDYVKVAAMCVAMVPTLVVFVTCQRVIMRGIILPQMH